MKITGLSHLFKWEHLHNWWLTKYFFAPLYIYIYIYLVAENRIVGSAARAQGLAFPACAHLSLSLSVRLHTSLSLCASAHLSHSHSLSLRLLSFCSACGREEQRFNSVKHRYYVVASLILHASIA